MDNILLIIGALIILSLIVGNMVYSHKTKKEALAAKPKDNRIYKVFEITYEGTLYYVIKRYWYSSMSSTHSWELHGDYESYKDLSKESVMTICDELNELYLKRLHNKQMTNMLDSTNGTIVH